MSVLTPRLPAVHVVLALEEAPRVIFDCLDDAEEARLDDWLCAHPSLLELLARALAPEAA